MDAYRILIESIMVKLLEWFDTLVTTDKPFVSLAFPTSGLASTYIPDNVTSDIIGFVVNANEYNMVIRFMDLVTPYLKFIFLLLTVILTILSVVLQLRKVLNKNKDNK